MSDAVAEFCKLTGADADRAQFYISAADGDLELAVSSYFDSDGGAEPMADVQGAGASATAAPSSSAAAASVSKPRIATFASMNADDDDDDEKRQELYAGGKTSGIAIQGGPKKQDPADVKSVFDAAKSHGAKAAHEVEEEAAASAPRFSGRGYRLGETGEDSAMVAAPEPAQSQDPAVIKVTVTFYRNGFTVDDSMNPPTLRDPRAPENMEFLDSIMSNQMPRELLAMGKTVDLHLIDQREEEYTPPKPTVKSFSGTGHRLGAPTPEMAAASAAAAAAAAAAPATSSAPPVVNESEPVTKLQLKLADGTRMVARFNLTQPISDIRRFIDASRPSGTPYVLMTTFPNRVLSDESLTLEAAQLANAVVIQRHA